VSDKNFWFVSLCALLAIGSCTEWNIAIRIAVAANAIVVLLNVIRDARRLYYGNGKKKD